jgi:hypothetical protein
LIDHVKTDDDFRQDPRVVEVWKLRIEAQPETTDIDLFAALAGNHISFSDVEEEGELRGNGQAYVSDSDFST